MFASFCEAMHASEQLRFWSEVEAFQNIRWKPLSLLGIVDGEGGGGGEFTEQMHDVKIQRMRKPVVLVQQQPSKSTTPLDYDQSLVTPPPHSPFAQRHRKQYCRDNGIEFAQVEIHKAAVAICKLSNATCCCSRTQRRS